MGMENTENEPYQYFPRCPGRAGPTRCAGAGQSGARPIADAGGLAFGVAEPGTLRHPGPAAGRDQITGGHPLSGPDPSAAAGGPGADRRSLWRALLAGVEEG